MNNEIKEILDFKENADYKKLSCDEIAILRDYITNLQQENKQFEKINERLYKQDTNKIKDLKKELEIIQEKLQKSNQFGAYRMKECSDYKLRIEKAVEYISSNCILSREWEELEFCKFLAIETITYKELSRGKIKELLNILEGKDTDDI